MKLQLIIATLTSGLLIAQEVPKPEPNPPRAPDPTEAPAPPPRDPRREGDQPRREGDQPRRGADQPRREGEQPRAARPEGDRGPDRYRPDADGAGRPRPVEAERRGNQINPNQNVNPPMPRVPQVMQPYIGLVTRMTGPELSAQLKQPEGFGLIVDAVLDDSPAKAAGLERNDLVQKLDDQWLVNPQQFEALVRRAGKGTDVSLTILRRGEEKKIGVKVAEKMTQERRAVRYIDAVAAEYRELREDLSPRDPQPRQEYRIEGPRGTDNTRRAFQEAARFYGEGGLRRQEGAMTYEITGPEGRRVFTAKEHDGSIQWTKPVNSPDEIEALGNIGARSTRK